jgi:MFS family permease
LATHYDHPALKNNPSPEVLKKSLRASLGDGASWSLTVGFAEIYFAPFAIFLGAANVAIGLLSTVPQLIGDLFHLASPRLVALLRSRKRLVLAAVALQGLALVLASFSPRFSDFRLAFLFAAASLYWIFCSIAAPAWQSWMGDLVPPPERGRFFAERNRVIQIVTFAALLAGGAVLHVRPGLEGFLILLGLGALGRGLSFLFLARQEDLPASELGAPAVSFRAFLKAMHRNNFGIYVLYASLFSFAVNLSASYFTPYMLEELKLSYLEFMALIAVMVGTKFLTAPFWGRLIDRHGSRKPLIGACALFCLPPLLWLASQNYLYLIALQVVAGIAIGGFELCTFNFLLENAAPKDRTRFAAYYEVLTGVGVVAGAVAGGLILRHAALPGLTPYFAAFLGSGVLRVFISALFLPRIR